MRGKNDDGDSWKPFENGILTLVHPKQNSFFGAIIEIVSLGDLPLKIRRIEGCHSCREKIADSVSREAFPQTRRFIRLPILWQLTEPS